MIYFWNGESRHSRNTILLVLNRNLVLLTKVKAHQNLRMICMDMPRLLISFLSWWFQTCLMKPIYQPVIFPRLLLFESLINAINYVVSQSISGYLMIWLLYLLRYLFSFSDPFASIFDISMNLKLWDKSCFIFEYLIFFFFMISLYEMLSVLWIINIKMGFMYEVIFHSLPLVLMHVL